MRISGAAPIDYNGTFAVLSVSAPNKFRYLLSSRPASNTAPGSTQKVLGVEHFLAERNTVELAPFKADSVSPPATPIALQLKADAAASQPAAYVYGDVILRDNKVRYLDGQYDTAFVGYALDVQGARNLLVRNNVLESAPAVPLRNQRCGAVTYFNNRTPAGVLVEGFNPDTAQKYAELETDNDLALILSLFNRRAR